MKKFTVLSLLLIFISSFAFAGTIQLPQTGQIKCYDTEGTEIPCAGTGQDGEIQAGVSWPEPRFTDNGDGTMTDNLTGLMWAENGNLPALTMTWDEAIDFCTNLNLGGYSDWSLPNVNELESLINCNEADNGTWLNAQGFTDVQTSEYWSSTVFYDFNKVSAWFVSMWDGSVYFFNMSFSYYVWPVRGGQDVHSPAPVWKTGQTNSYKLGDDGDLQRGVAWPEPRFADNKDGTVTDNLTGLMWTKDGNLPGTESWQHALNYIKNMNDSRHANFGHNDWRLSNRKELHSLTDYSKDIPALPSGHPFINVPGGYYWSSTTDVYDTGSAWNVVMAYGYFYNHDKPETKYVWPVRGGEVPLPRCSTLTDVIAKYEEYKNGQATLRDVIECFKEWRATGIGR